MLAAGALVLGEVAGLSWAKAGALISSPAIAVLSKIFFTWLFPLGGCIAQERNPLLSRCVPSNFVNGHSVNPQPIASSRFEKRECVLLFVTLSRSGQRRRGSRELTGQPASPVLQLRYGARTGSGGRRLPK